LAKNREYHSYLGRFRGSDIVVVSHGVGSAGAAICFQELIDAGAKQMIRIGTAGTFIEGMNIGGILIPTGAIRNDGVSALMVPSGYPAIADLQMTNSLVKKVQKSGQPYACGLVLTSDIFYPGKLDNQFQFFRDAGAIGVEIECSTLFIIAQLRKVRPASLLVSDGNPLSNDANNYDPSPDRLSASIRLCFDAALEVLVEV
jgi:uridine phosphorylase